jgi:hypothetical protein
MHPPLMRNAACGFGALALAALVLAGCGGVQVRPMPGLPQPLLQPMPARVGLVLDADLRNYLHEETRGGSGWHVDLGPGHAELFRSMLGASFGTLEVFETPEAARAAGNLQTVFRPYIEQFSFATAQETGGQYWAVTIRYRIGITAPTGETIDSLTLTGYGSTRGGRAANALTRATRSAMRDAAAKFLVQMPQQPLARKLVQGQVLSIADAAAAKVDVIETVPIEPETQAP